MKFLIKFIFLLIVFFQNSINAIEYVKIIDSNGEIKNFSRIIMGTDHLFQTKWAYNGENEKTDEECYKILDEVVSKGINVFDTSPIYSGSVEYKIGKWLVLRKDQILLDSFYENKNYNPDRKIYIISKGGFPFDLSYSKTLPDGLHSKELLNKLSELNILKKDSDKLPDIPSGSYASRLYGTESQITNRLSEEINISNVNLNNNITCYLFHRDDNDFINFEKINRTQTPVKTLINIINSFRENKDFMYFGFSNWNNARINEAIKILNNDLNNKIPVFNSPYFSLFEMSEKTIHAGGEQVKHEDMKNPDFQKGVYIMTYSPLGGFSILDRPYNISKEDSYKKYIEGDSYWKNVYRSIFTKENEERYKRAFRFMLKFNKENNTKYTLDQFFNAYVLAHKRADFLIVGPLNSGQLDRTVNSIELSKKLTVNDIDYLYYGIQK